MRLGTPTIAVKRPLQLAKLFRPGFINKGNSCYTNSLIQALSTMRGFWSHAVAGPQSQVASQFQDLIGKMSFSKCALDPSASITALQHVCFNLCK